MLASIPCGLTVCPVALPGSLSHPGPGTNAQGNPDICSHAVRKKLVAAIARRFHSDGTSCQDKTRARWGCTTVWSPPPPMKENNCPFPLSGSWRMGHIPVLPALGSLPRPETVFAKDNAGTIFTGLAEEECIWGTSPLAWKTARCNPLGDEHFAADRVHIIGNQTPGKGTHPACVPKAPSVLNGKEQGSVHVLKRLYLCLAWLMSFADGYSEIRFPMHLRYRNTPPRRSVQKKRPKERNATGFHVFFLLPRCLVQRFLCQAAR